ncbi:MAG: hypothetical protein ACI8V0_002722, partial [Pseudohongiellaceae bacterium]
PLVPLEISEVTLRNSITFYDFAVRIATEVLTP